MREYLGELGLGHVQVPDSSWGDTIASAIDAATMLGMAVQGPLLDEPMRSRAMELMGTVSPWQDWGALAGVSVAGQLGIKNGWFPESDGWQLNSLSFVRPTGSPLYVIAIFADGYALFGDGVAELEQLSIAIHAAMQQRPALQR
jgi:hypothetical protein